MPDDAYQLEQTTDRYLLEDDSGVLLLEQQPGDGAGAYHYTMLRSRIREW